MGRGTYDMTAIAIVLSLSHRPIFFTDSIDYPTIRLSHYRPNPNYHTTMHMAIIASNQANVQITFQGENLYHITD